MPRIFEKPTVTFEEGSTAGELRRHPAYAQIAASRVSGSAVLYGSELQHHNYIAIRINTSEHKRTLSRDWFHARHEIVEVLLSEAQWATFVSAMNVGDGVPCTLSSVDRKQVPQIPEPEETHHDTFAKEAAKALFDVKKRIIGIAASLPKDGPLSKTKVAEVARSLHVVAEHLTGNVNFVAESFQEHMEAVTEKAKIEVNAFVTSAVMRAGLKALKDQPVVALLEKHDDKDGE